MDLQTGESGEKKLEHAQGEAERYYRSLLGPVRIGMESTGNCQWFTELLVSLGLVRFLKLYQCPRGGLP